MRRNETIHLLNSDPLKKGKKKGWIPSEIHNKNKGRVQLFPKHLHDSFLLTETVCESENETRQLGVCEDLVTALQDVFLVLADEGLQS